MENSTIEIQQELIQSNEMLRIQIWILGGIISFILVLITFMARSAWMDMRGMLADHEKRIREIENHKIDMEGVTERHAKDIEDHRTQMDRLEVTVQKITRR